MQRETTEWRHADHTDRDDIDVESATRAVIALVQAQLGDSELVTRLAFSTAAASSHARVYHFDVIGGTPVVQRRVTATISDGDVWEAVFAD